MTRPLKISFLLFFFALCGVAAVVTHLHQKETPPPAARELYSIVNQQLSALRADDFDTAYRQAASGVHQKFSRDQFELMIRRDFSSMTEAQRIEFGIVQVAGGVAYAQVFLTTPGGARRGYLYSFTAETDGWKIDGVQPIGPQTMRPARGLSL
ncbi:MAG: DUF4864 domain-containing protein [Chthoniobacterales bacterium]